MQSRTLTIKRVHNKEDRLYEQVRSIQNQTPFVFFDKAGIEKTCQRFIKTFKPYSIFYSVKANSELPILKIIKSQGLNFDVASWGEIKKLRSIGVPSSKIIFSAPTKLHSHIKHAYDAGIDTFAFDSKVELEKLSTLAPGSKIIARIAVDNEGSEWPLVRKFGLTNEEALELIPYAKELGLKPIGLTFHVGSQNLKATTWARALERVYSIWLDLKLKNISLDVINIGGGFPARYEKNIPTLEEIGKVIKKSVTDLFGKHVTLYIEPGRSIVANSGILVTTIVNKAKRDGDTWLYIDTGVFHGLQETLEHFRYRIISPRGTSNTVPFVLCGPTCDSADTIMENVYLPKSTEVGDRLLFLTAGAYTVSYEHYNGFEYPQTIISKT